MQILKFPDLFLFQKTREVTVFGPELAILLDEMYSIMKANNGMGLAANQVGLQFSMFVMEYQGVKYELVNPILLEKSRFSAKLREGCLSAPGEFISVPSRAKWVRVQYETRDGELKNATFSNLAAVCTQHEMEHLRGESYMQNKSLSREVRKTLSKKWGI